LASLRQREREATALAAASESAARALAQALSEQSSNGIDDAFAPPMAVTGEGAGRRHDAKAGHAMAATARTTIAGSPLASLRLASGAALPARLHSELSFIADVPATGVDGSFLPVEPDAESAASIEQQDPEVAVDQLLDWLVANKYLSETRFVESRVNARARKQGTMMIKHELQRHGLALEPEQAAALRETEFARAQALWQRKFGELAPDARLRARQARFLAARGFAADVVRRIVGGEEEF
jgi:regulatory protein